MSSYAFFWDHLWRAKDGMFSEEKAGTLSSREIFVYPTAMTSFLGGIYEINHVSSRAGKVWMPGQPLKEW